MALYFEVIEWEYGSARSSRDTAQLIADLTIMSPKLDDANPTGVEDWAETAFLRPTRPRTNFILHAAGTGSSYSFRIVAFVKSELLGGTWMTATSLPTRTSFSK